MFNNHWTICPIIMSEWDKICHHMSNIFSSKFPFVQPKMFCPAPAVPAVPTFCSPGHNWYEHGQCWMVYDLEMYGIYKHRSTHRTQSLDEKTFEQFKITWRELLAYRVAKHLFSFLQIVSFLCVFSNLPCFSLIAIILIIFPFWHLVSYFENCHLWYEFEINYSYLQADFNKKLISLSQSLNHGSQIHPDVLLTIISSQKAKNWLISTLTIARLPITLAHVRMALNS